MEKEDIKKKKALSEDELLNVTGGDAGGGAIFTITCKDKKKPDTCAKIKDCTWNEATGKCEGEGRVSY